MIIHMTNPEAFRQWPIKRLFMHGLSQCKAPLDIAEALAQIVGDWRVGCFIGVEEDKPRTIVYVRLPLNENMDHPTIEFAANIDGSAELSQETFDTALRFIRDNGYTKVWAANRSRASDKVWSRMLRQHGVQLRPVVTTFELDLGEVEDDAGGV